MKLIKRGEPPEDKIIKLICSNCKSEFEAQHKELQCFSDFRNGFYYVWRCTVCKKENYT